MENESQTRIVQDVLRYAILKSPAFATLALWCPWTVTDARFTARTDGHSIRFGARFFAHPPLEQTAILVRAVLHIALCHLPRAYNRDPLAWNFCANLALHEMLEDVGWLTMPTGFHRMQDVLSTLSAWSGMPNSRTSEPLYDHLIRYRNKLEELFPPSEWDLDFTGPMHSPYAEQVWARRLARARSEERPNNLLKLVEREFPAPAERWEQIRQRRLPHPLPIQERTGETEPLPPLEAFFEPDPMMPAHLPSTAEGLYDLTYHIVGECESLEAFQRAGLLFGQFDRLSPPLKGVEIQTLAMELLMTKAHSMGLLHAFTRTPEYKAYRTQTADLFDLPAVLWSRVCMSLREHRDGKAGMVSREQEHIVQTAMRYAVSKSPGFAAIALWCPYIVTSEPFIAMTNGRSIRFGAGFFTYAPLEQVAIVVHEILHVALRHIPRAQKGRREPLLWNICTDAVINETLAEMNWMTLPDDAIRMKLLLTMAELHQCPASQWTSEKLYEHLLQNKDRLASILACFGMDLEPGGDPDEPLEDQIWNHRLRRAQAGDRPGGLLREIGHDFPVETIPWERVLRRLMTQPLLPQTKVTWNRPSRRSLSLGTEFFEPGNRPQDGLQMAGVVIDTSGSINDALLTRFAQEIQAVQRRTGCDIYLISADAAVQTEQKVRNDGRSLQQKIASSRVQIKGGGGTDFYPALQRMKEQRVRVVIYLTDLYGNFGPETRYPFPVIWASTTKGEKAPFGVTLYLE